VALLTAVLALLGQITGWRVLGGFVGQAEDGRTAVDQVTRLLPDVVVMDIAMPALNGIEATRQLHERCPAVKVIILSMHGTRQHVVEAMQAGAQAYVLKRAAGQEVVAAVRAVQAGRRYLSEGITDIVVNDYIRMTRNTPSSDPLSTLSSREREILQLVAEGKASTEIANTLFLSPKTVYTYRARIMEKLGLHDSVALVRFAVERGLTPGG
jgi:DNA-binding NarL/FixJ family response regulator